MWPEVRRITRRRPASPGPSECLELADACTAPRYRAPTRSANPGADAQVTMHRKTVDADGAPAAIGPYSHAVRTGDLLFCSGQIPLDPDTGELVGETPAEQ